MYSRGRLLKKPLGPYCLLWGRYAVADATHNLLLRFISILTEPCRTWRTEAGYVVMVEWWSLWSQSPRLQSLHAVFCFEGSAYVNKMLSLGSLMLSPSNYYLFFYTRASTVQFPVACGITNWSVVPQFKGQRNGGEWWDVVIKHFDWSERLEKPIQVQSIYPLPMDCSCADSHHG